MSNFKKVISIVTILFLLLVVWHPTVYATPTSRQVEYHAEIKPFGKIDKEIAFPPDHDPFYLHLDFFLSPGTVTADLVGDIIFNQTNRTITLRGRDGNFSADSELRFTGTIEMDFVLTVEFYHLLFGVPSLALVVKTADLVVDLPEIDVHVNGPMPLFEFGKSWEEHAPFNSFLLNGESVTVRARGPDILSKKLSAIDIAGLIVTATTGIPPFAVKVAKKVIKVGLGDSRIRLNAGLTSDFTFSGERITVNDQQVTREEQSVPAPGLDLSQNNYAINTSYVGGYTSKLDLLFRTDIELSFNPLGIVIWEYDKPFAELPINIVPERQNSLTFDSAPDKVVFPIIQMQPVQPRLEPAGRIPHQTLTAVDSTTTVDVSRYFTPANNARTYTVQSNPSSIVRTSTSGSLLTIRARTVNSTSSTTVIVTARDPNGETAEQTIAVTVEVLRDPPCLAVNPLLLISGIGGLLVWKRDQPLKIHVLSYRSIIFLTSGAALA